MSGVGVYAPRAREDSMRPRRLICASGRPLNFTVRPPPSAPRLRLTPYGTAVYWDGVQLRRDAALY